MADNAQTTIWLEEARRGDSVAVSKLLATYHPLLRARADERMEPSLKARSEPEDILQQVYLEVFRRIERFEDRSPNAFLNWVLTILDNKVIDTRRALHRQVRDIAREVPPQVQTAGDTDSYWNLLGQLCPDSQTPSRAARRDEAVGALLACMSSLSDSHRRVIQLRFIESRSVAEVAGRLQKSESAVVALTQRALKALRESMDRLGEFTHG